MEYKDYYKTLGVEKTVGKEELKKQYRKLARKFHPDVNTSDKNAGLRFGEISEAYEVLSDDEKRQKYDAFGSDWEQHQKSGSPNDFDWTKYTSARSGQGNNHTRNQDDIFGEESDMSEFFRNIFGQGFHDKNSSGFAVRGQDLSAELTISLEEAYAGGTRILAIGANRLRLKLKPGIWDRQKIKINGKGAPGSNGAANGDLYLTFLLQPHPEYRLEGTDLFKDIDLGIYSAMLGATLEVKTISGTFELKIPPETKNGMIFRLKGKGFPVYDKPGTNGNLFLKIMLQIPEKLTEQEKKLVRELAALRQEKPDAEKSEGRKP